MAFLTGLWPLVWHFGIGFGVTGIALLVAFEPWIPLLPIIRKTALWVAFTAVVITFTYAIGVKNGEARIQAQWDIAVANEIERGNQERVNAERDIPDVPTPRVRGKKLDRDDRD